MADSSKEFTCPLCARTFSHKSSLSRHKKTCKGVPKKQAGVYKCPRCEKQFARKFNLERHAQLAHGNDLIYQCGLCPAFFPSLAEVEQHRRTRHRNRSKFVLLSSAHGKACQTYRLYLPKRYTTNFSGCIDYAMEKAELLIRHLIVEKRHMKVGLNLSLRFAKPEFNSGGGGDGSEEAGFGAEEREVITYNIRPTSRVYTFGDHEANERRLADSFGEIGERFGDFNHRGSGWILVDCLYLDVDVGQCLSMQGSCSIHRVRSQNDRVWVAREDSSQPDGGDFGHRCFFHAVASVLLTNRKKDAGVADNQQHTELELETFVREHIHETVEAPVPLKRVKSFETANSHLDLAVNVIYGGEDGFIYPAYASSNLKARNQVVLLLFHRDMAIEFGLSDEQKQALHQDQLADYGDEASAHLATPEGMQAVMHYAPVYDVSRMFARRVTNERFAHEASATITHTRPRYHCYNCFNAFQSEAALLSHVSYCHSETGQVYEVPKPNAVVAFEPRRKSFKLGYMFFFDFETLQIQPDKPCSCAPERVEAGKCKHKTQVLSEQKAFAYSLLCVDRDGFIFRDVTYVGEDAVDHFLRSLRQLEEDVIHLLSEVKPMIMSDLDKRQHEQATVCYICLKPFEKKSKTRGKCADHDHLNGLYVGAAHLSCNLHRREIMKLVGFAHNFSGYDSHLLMEALAESDYYRDSLDAIPLNSEKFKMLKLGSVVMLDSTAFLPASLDKLVENLVVSGHTFPITEQWLPSSLSDDMREKKDLVMRKGVYPYEYMTGMDKLTHGLPAREQFYSRLSGKHISEADYEHVKKVWDRFGLTSMRQLTELYVLSDTYQLAEAVVDLRDRIFNEFRLDLCHYLSLPMMTKDIMLKTTGVKMSLMSDLDMIFFIKNNIRGGLSFVNTRHTLVGEETDQTLNPRQEMFQRFEQWEERAQQDGRSCIVYGDVNNLYGHAMRMSMPLGDFEWLTEAELAAFDPVNMVSDDAPVGYILEVTLDYPEELHLDHNSFPLAPEHVAIDESMLSPYATNALQTLTKKSKHKASKLTATLRTRKEYVCHGLNLQLYLKHGLKLVCIHRGIKFQQRKFLKPYIDQCTAKRAAAKTKTGKDLQKLLANSLYGKLIESGANRMDVRFVTGKKSAILRNTDPRTQSHLIFHENLSVALMKKRTVRLNQSWAVGFTVLELSKYHMQQLFYDVVKPAFGGRVSVLLSDTDSWVMKLPEPSTDLALSKLSSYMDFSNYPDAHKLKNDSVKNQTGYLKNECPGTEIVEVVGVRAKTYAIRTASNELQRRCKGVKTVTRDRITLDDYRKCVRSDILAEHSIEQHSIQSRKHVNKLMKQRKLAFSSFDDKRYLLPCGQHSVPYGSALLQQISSDSCFFCEHPDIMT